ncbi:hypothetical protein [Micromonospora sp. NBC_01813]|uniref:hypothetical protein n=1 Tax=Micromonospora sp. NBC_01813 TaxID=2975988 RepID=UPI002DDC28AD|nr:hypothetical protein [Micromonospora sp. NBC_01813]WSA09236.1 hypothetical protein OG958_34700 [Micromonospora sp. NBC_01813]
MTNSQPVAALTCLMAGQVPAHDRRVQRFTEADRQHYLDLLSALLVLCADRRFRRDDQGAVIRFVASVRERFDPDRTLVSDEQPSPAGFDALLREVDAMVTVPPP